MADSVQIQLHMVEDATRALNDINRSVGECENKVKSLNTTFANFSNVANTIRSVWGAISGTVGSVIELGGQAEMTSVAFKTLIGDEEKAAALLDDINAYAEKTPFSQLDLVDSAKTMLNFGMSTEEVNEKLRQLGDISMGDKNKLGSLSLVLGQVASANKLQGQDLLQFINQGFNPLKELADMTEMKYEDLQKAMSKGAISAEMVYAAIAHATGEGGKFNGMADKLSETFEGKLSTAIGKFQKIGIELFNKLEPTLMKLIETSYDFMGPLEKIGSLLVSIVGKLVDWAPVIVAVTSAIVSYNVAINAVQMATKAWAAAQAIVNVALTLNPIGLVVAGVTILIAAVLKLTGGWDNLVAHFKERGIIDGIIQIGKAIVRFITAPITAILGLVAKIPGLESLQGYIDKFHNALSVEDLLTKENYAVGATFSGKDNATMSVDDIKKNLANATGDTKAGSKTKQSANAVATGGTRNTQITINFSKEMVKMDFNGGYQENAQNIERTLEESLLRVLNSAKAAI